MEFQKKCARIFASSNAKKTTQPIPPTQIDSNQQTAEDDSIDNDLNQQAGENDTIDDDFIPPPPPPGFD